MCYIGTIAAKKIVAGCLTVKGAEEDKTTKSGAGDRVRSRKENLPAARPRE